MVNLKTLHINLLLCLNIRLFLLVDLMTDNGYLLNSVIGEYLFTLNSYNTRFPHKHKYDDKDDFNILQLIPFEGKTPYTYATVKKCKKCGYIRHIELEYLDCRIYKPFVHKWCSAYDSLLFHSSITVDFHIDKSQLDYNVPFVLLSSVQCPYNCSICCDCCKYRKQCSFSYVVLINSKIGYNEHLYLTICIIKFIKTLEGKYNFTMGTCSTPRGMLDEGIYKLHCMIDDYLLGKQFGPFEIVKNSKYRISIERRNVS